MSLKKFFAAAAVASLTVTPAIAAPANPAKSLSVTKSVRASAPGAKSNKLGEGAGGIAAAAIAAGIVAIGVIAVVKSDDSDSN